MIYESIDINKIIELSKKFRSKSRGTDQKTFIHSIYAALDQMGVKDLEERKRYIKLILSRSNRAKKEIKKEVKGYFEAPDYFFDL